VDRLEEDRMENNMAVIMRRLAEVRPVRGNVRAPSTGPSIGPGVSRYQRRSAHLRERDCSIELADIGELTVNLAGD